MIGIPFPSRSYVSVQKLLRVALEGFVATAPMSLSMLLGWRLLPKREQYHLPPRQITEKMAERVGIEDRLNENELIGLTMGILSPATRHPWRRNLLMIVAHVIWGVTLGEGVRKLNANT